MKVNLAFSISKWLFLSLWAVALWGCASARLIYVGVAAEMSGKQSEASLNMRNGVRMAAEEINERGGINGRKIEVLVEDDQGEPAGAIQADSNLIDKGVVAIIGHLTSNQTVAGYSVTEKKQTVLFSPTAATSILTGKKDHFFRLFPTNDSLGKQFARYVIQQRGIRQVGILYDQDNDTYTVPFADSFEETLSSAGGKVTAKVKFHGSQSPGFVSLVEQLKDSGAEGVFIIASSSNAALIAQEIRLANWNVPLFAAPWSQGDDLILNGGKAVEGLELLMPYDLNDPSPSLQDFKNRYQARYKQTPTFAAIFGYESMNILAAALEKTGGSDTGLVPALEKTGNFEGLAGLISLDEFGDVRRPLYIMAVQNKQFATKMKLPLETP